MSWRVTKHGCDERYFGADLTDHRIVEDISVIIYLTDKDEDAIRKDPAVRTKMHLNRVFNGSSDGGHSR